MFGYLLGINDLIKGGETVDYKYRVSRSTDGSVGGSYIIVKYTGKYLIRVHSTNIIYSYDIKEYPCSTSVILRIIGDVFREINCPTTTSIKRYWDYPNCGSWSFVYNHDETNGNAIIYIRQKVSFDNGKAYYHLPEDINCVSVTKID